MSRIGYLRFVQRVLGVELTDAQRVCDDIAFDGTQPEALKGDDRRLARLMYGDIKQVPRSLALSSSGRKDVQAATRGARSCEACTSR